jgi:hypothetical protein
MDDVHANDGAEGPALERQRFRPAPYEVGSRDLGAGTREHAWGGIEAHGAASGSGGDGRPVAGAAADVEDGPVIDAPAGRSNQLGQTGGAASGVTPVIAGPARS